MYDTLVKRPLTKSQKRCVFNIDFTLRLDYFNISISMY